MIHRVSMATTTRTSLSIEWNLMRLSGAVHRIMTKTVHKILPVGGGGEGMVGWRVYGVVGVLGVGARDGGVGYG